MTDRELSQTVCTLVDYAVRCELIDRQDRAWAYNSVLAAVGACGPAPRRDWPLTEPEHEKGFDSAAFDLEGTLERLSEHAVHTGVAEDTATGRDRAAMRVMGVLTPRPSDVAATFHRIARTHGVHAATDWFYRLCCDAGYVRRAAIARNVAWTTDTRWGTLEITINRSKPEKDPRDIAAAGAARSTDETYPACQLCIENEGYPGRSASVAGGHPARQNLRILPIELGGERWGLQYSPYAYYNEHCIAMSSHHRPMHIDAKALECLLDFVDAFPHYFIGSNADLPIVGGSILSHDHYQGGGHEFPMMHAKVERTFDLEEWPDVSGEVLVWPMSVLRLRGRDRAHVAQAAVHVINAWRAWTDESVGVLAHTPDGTPHNTVTPVVRRVDKSGHTGGEAYEIYLTLRCNMTSEEHPLGIFHPHEEYHHIKKENIGLIEVMGLAILPARLVDELAAVKDHLLSPGSREDTEQALAQDPRSRAHAAWALQVRDEHPELDAENAEAILHEEVGQVFSHVLEDAGIFKFTDEGRAACQRFLATL